MKLSEAKQQFISSWGAFGTHWGINRTMAQIHALLLVSADPMTQDDIMEELNISRGNTNMNIRELINWGLVERVILPGERKEFSSRLRTGRMVQRFFGSVFLSDLLISVLKPFPSFTDKLIARTHGQPF